MTEPEELVWYEADGTRHVFGAPPAGGPDAASGRESAVPAAPPEPAAESTVAAPAEGERQVEAPAVEESQDEPSALRSMVRALALGAAAAAATGAAVGAISLAATGDRPDTTGTTVPPTEVAVETSARPEVSDTGGIERIELEPATTSADQPD